MRIIIFVLLSKQAYSQKILPASSTVVDKKIVEQCQKRVDDINSMPLKGDTILFMMRKATLFILLTRAVMIVEIIKNRITFTKV